MKYKKLAIASAFLLSLLTAQVQAGFYDWEGGTSDDWSDSLNWQNGATLGAEDTARIYNSDISSDPTPNNTVLKTGADVTLTRVWVGNSGDANESGVLTVESGASLTASADFNLENNSTLTSSGAISVGSGNGMLVRDSANVTLKNDSTLNKLNLEQNSTATLEAGSTVSTLRLTGDSQVTMEAGSSAATIQIEADSHLTMNNTRTGNLNVNTRSSLTVNATIDGDINYSTDGTGLIAETGTVDGNLNANRNSSVTVNGTVTGNLTANNTSSVTVNGTVTGNLTANKTTNVIVNGTVTGTLRAGEDSSVTLNGTVNTKFDPASTAMLYIGEDGILNGDIELNGSDQMTVAGSVNGRFSINQTAQVIIESTANILSDSDNSWIYNTAAVTWNVGANGRVGTLKTSRDEQNAGQFDGEWRYSNSAVDMVVDLTNCTVYGSSITLQLVSGIENESTFADNVTFLYDGAEVTGFTWDGAGTGSFSGVLANPAPDADNDGVADVDDAFPNDPNESADSDGDTVGDNADAFPNNPNETVDTDGDSVGDNSDQHNGLDDTVINNALGITTADGKINLSAWLATNSYTVNDGNSGGISQSDYDAALAAQATAETALANAREARTGSTVIDVANDVATITLTVEQTTDVSDWSNATSSDHDIQLSAPAGASFYRFNYPEE